MRHTNCGAIIPSFYEQLTFNAVDYLMATSGDFLTVVNKAYGYDEKGKEDLADKQWDIANDLIYFNLYLMIIQQQRQIKARAGVEYDYDELTETWKIDCIRKHFACFNIDIDPILELFSFTRAGLDGIDYMNIEIGDNPWEIL